MRANTVVTKCFITATVFGLLMFLTYLQYTSNRCSFVCDAILKPKEADSTALLHRVNNATICDVKQQTAVTKCVGSGSSADKIRLIKDLLEDQGSPDGTSAWNNGLNIATFKAEEIPHVAHYVWCGEKFFRFEDYLGVLSIIRVLKPFKLIFHYHKLPVEKDLYHTWFQELKQSLPFLVLRATNKEIKCSTGDALNYGLEQLAASPGGGFYFGERAVLTYLPDHWKQEDSMTYIMPGAKQSEETIVFTKHGLNQTYLSLEQYKTNLLNNSHECLTIDKFNKVLHSSNLYKPQTNAQALSPCLIIKGSLYPENIISNDSPFGKLARFLYYGKSESLNVKPRVEDPKDLIPSISHMILLNPSKDKPVNLTFSHYLSILSALYLGGFNKVYIHGNTNPSCDWWNRLTNENVTFVHIEEVETIFQQEVKVYAHQSDILRTLILYKYGGAYQDKDALWTSPVSDDVRRYPTVACYDWVDRGEWPRSFNLGVMMSKPGAPFLRKFLESFWYQWDTSWIFNGVLMPYKVYERHPDTLFIYKHLQTICYLNVCHPTWHGDYMRSENDATKPTGHFNLSDTNALHYTHPKPDSILTSFDAVMSGSSLLHELGKNLMRAIVKSGKKHLLEGANLDKL